MENALLSALKNVMNNLESFSTTINRELEDLEQTTIIWKNGSSGSEALDDLYFAYRALYGINPTTENESCNISPEEAKRSIKETKEWVKRQKEK